jgi:hypothetical protein
MIKLIYTQTDAALAGRLLSELNGAGYPAEDLVKGGNQARADVLIPVLSPQANGDAAVQTRISQALDNGQHIIPVLASPVALPRLIDHLGALDYSGGIDLAPLRARLDEIAAGNARLPLKVLTPNARKANRQAGLWVGLAALVMFGAGLYGVGVLGIQAPQDEYDTVATEAAATINAIVRPELEQYANFLPRSTDDAASYPATLRAVPTVYRVFMGLTATAVAADPAAATQSAAATPTPEATLDVGE